jgi:hypothetical protein
VCVDSADSKRFPGFASSRIGDPILARLEVHGRDLAVLVSRAVATAHRRPVPLEKRAPSLAAELDDGIRGSDDIGEQRN